MHRQQFELKNDEFYRIFVIQVVICILLPFSRKLISHFISLSFTKQENNAIAW